MAKFIVHFGVKDIPEPSYTRLRTTMESAGFSCFMLGDDGKRHKLPYGSFYIGGNIITATALGRAEAAMLSTGSSYQLTITETKNVLFKDF